MSTQQEMKTMTFIRILAGCFALFLAAAANADEARHYMSGDLMIHDVKARVIIASRPGAAYMVIQNTGDTDDRLLEVSSPLAARVELHTHIMEGDVAKMRQVDAIDIPAGGETALAPGGYHIMMFELHEGIEEGDAIPLTLTFEHGGDVDVNAVVDNRREGTSEGQGDHSSHSGGD
jgi:copper(I)-binding protein